MMFGLQHLKEKRDPLTESILAETEHMLAQGRMDVPLSLCFAAMRGDDLLLNQLLKRGTDPNELDSNGRTALVCNFLLLSVYTHLRPATPTPIYGFEMSFLFDTAYCSRTR